MQEGKPDRISDLLEESANEIEYLNSLLDDVRILCIVKENVDDYIKFDLINDLAQILRNQK